MNGVEWRATHVHYHGPLDDLALHAVRPLLRQLRMDSDIAAVYWQRHWRRGPHLRINVRTSPDVHTGRVHHRIADCVGGYLARFPSSATLDPGVTRVLHTELAWREEDAAPLWPWLADNTIHHTAYEDRSAVLGRELAELAVTSCVDTNDLVFTTVEQYADEHERRGHAFDLLAATAHVACGLGIGWGFTALRAEAETVRTLPGGTACVEAWQRDTGEVADWCRARLDGLVAALDNGDLSAFPLVRQWLAHCDTYRPHIAHCVYSGSITPPQRFGGQHPVPRPRGAVGPLLLESMRGCGFRSAVRSAWFATYRVLLHLLDVHLDRIGIGVYDRLYLCHLVAATVEETDGTSLPETLHRLPGRSDAAGMLARALAGAAPRALPRA